MLKGQAKTDYQRKYMRQYMRDYRLKGRVVKTQSVKTLDAASPVTSPAPTTWVDADGNPVYND